MNLQDYSPTIVIKPNLNLLEDYSVAIIMKVNLVEDYSVIFLLLLKDLLDYLVIPLVLLEVFSVVIIMLVPEDYSLNPLKELKNHLVDYSVELLAL